MSSSLPSFDAGPFWRVIASSAEAQCIWRFLNENSSLQKFEDSSRAGRPALEALERELKAGFVVLRSGDKTADLFKRMVGRMVRQIMERDGFVFERSGVPIQHQLLFKTAARYRRRR